MKIVVKSNPEFFEKEKDGRKPNTIRMLDGKDTVLIQNSKNPEEFIIRTITDISVWKGAIIISFKPEPIQELKKELKKKFPGSEVEVEEQPTKVTVKIKEKPMKPKIKLREKFKKLKVVKKRGKRGSYKKKPFPEGLECPECKSTSNIVRAGFKKREGFPKAQIYRCNECRISFIKDKVKRGRASLKSKYIKKIKKLYKDHSAPEISQILANEDKVTVLPGNIARWLSEEGVKKEIQEKPKEEQKEGLMAQSFKYFKDGLSDEEIAGLLKVKESMIETFRGYWKRGKRTNSPKVILKEKPTLEKDGVETVEEKDWEDEDTFGGG